MTTITITSKRKQRKGTFAPGNIVRTDITRTGIVYSVCGDDITIHYERPYWPWPDREVRKASEVELMGIEIERQYEEALL